MVMNLSKKDYQIDINIDLSNYLISDILNGISINYTDLELENIVKFFCISRIRKYYTNFNVIIMDNDALEELTLLENVNGLVKSNCIYLKRENVLNLRNGKIDIIRTIMHEVEHVRQTYLLENNDISYKTYLTLMDEIVSYKVGKKFYKENYEYIFTEIDARAKAEFKLFDYLSKYCPKILNKELDNILENILQCEEDASFNYRIINGEKYDLEELFDLIIKNNPSIVSECPILNFYYDQDGNKIPLGKLIERKNASANNESDDILLNKVKILDNYIIRNRRGSKESLEEDIYSILSLNNKDNEDIILTLYDRINNNNSNDISMVYDILQSKLDTLKCRINNKKIAAEKYAKKVYSLFK